MKMLTAGWLILVGAMGVPVAMADLEEVGKQSRYSGVVVEKVGKGSALEKAGLQPGDILYSWKRLARPPADTEPASGRLLDPFDWSDLVIEQAPRGMVLILGEREGEVREIAVEPGSWEADIRPVIPSPLEPIYSKGREYLNSKEVGAAVRQWKSLEADLRLAGLESAATWLALRMGRISAEHGEWETAIESYRGVLRSTGMFSAQIASWLGLAECYQGMSDLEAAQEAYSAALDIQLKLGSNNLMTARILSNQGTLAWIRRDLDTSEEYIARALEIRDRFAPQSLDLAQSLDDLGTLASARGELGTADEYFHRAMEIGEQRAPNSLFVARTLDNLGHVDRLRGELDQALGHHLEARRIYQQLAFRGIEVPNNLNHLGAVARARGFLDQAHDYYLQSLRLHATIGSESPEAAACLNNLGVVAHDRGDFSRARDYFLESLRMREEFAPRSLQTKVVLNNLGMVALAREDFDGAHKYFRRALVLAEEFAPGSLTVAASLSNLGAVARAHGDLEAARSYHLRSLEIKERLAPGSLKMASSLSNLGSIAQALGELDLARNYHLQSLNIRELLAPQTKGMAESLKSLGDIDLAEEDWDSALVSYGRALEVLEHQFSRLGGSYSVRANFRSQHRDYFHGIIDLLLGRGSLSEAFTMVERYRAQIFLAMLAERDTVFTADISEELDRERRVLAIQHDRTLKQLAQLSLEVDRGKIEDLRRELERLNNEAGSIQEQIRFASPQLANLQYPRPLDVVEVRDSLDPGTLLLSYSVGRESTVLFSLSKKDDLAVNIIPLREETLRARVESLRALVNDALPGLPLGQARLEQFWSLSREIYTELLEPVEGRIANNKRLLILPDGPLHELSFAALTRTRDLEGGQYLVEWKPIHVALSSTVYDELMSRRYLQGDSGTTQSSSVQLVAIGDPLYPQRSTQIEGSSEAEAYAKSEVGSGVTGSICMGADRDDSVAMVTAAIPRGDAIVRSVTARGVFEWKRLPYTRQEVERIAGLFPEGLVRIFLGPDALEEKVKNLSRETRILHIAAHGQADRDLPSSSFLALTIPENPREGQDNGLLQMWEILERVRIDADLVVLSACDSGLGQELGGEGLIGLTRAFQYAGARSVVASLWKVADQATAELMIRFYRHLRLGLPNDQALRAAQVELIRGPIEVTGVDGKRIQRDASAPYYWAAFQVFGDWQ